jgi:hypothetical protein
MTKGDLIGTRSVNSEGRDKLSFAIQKLLTKNSNNFIHFRTVPGEYLRQSWPRSGSDLQTQSQHNQPSLTNFLESFFGGFLFNLTLSLFAFSIHLQTRFHQALLSFISSAGRYPLLPSTKDRYELFSKIANTISITALIASTRLRPLETKQYSSLRDGHSHVRR